MIKKYNKNLLDSIEQMAIEFFEKDISKDIARAFNELYIIPNRKIPTYPFANYFISLYGTYTFRAVLYTEVYLCKYKNYTEFKNGLFNSSYTFYYEMKFNEYIFEPLIEFLAAAVLSENNELCDKYMNFNFFLDIKENSIDSREYYDIFTSRNTGHNLFINLQKALCEMFQGLYNEDKEFLSLALKKYWYLKQQGDKLGKTKTANSYVDFANFCQCYLSNQVGSFLECALSYEANFKYRKKFLYGNKITYLDLSSFLLYYIGVKREYFKVSDCPTSFQKYYEIKEIEYRYYYKNITKYEPYLAITERIVKDSELPR
jgi:hypothetical protein